jgi:ankyrin repeat protein
MNRAPVSRFIPSRPTTVNNPVPQLVKGTIDQFIASVSSGDLEEIREFVMNNKNNWSVVDPSGNSPVHTLLGLDKRVADNEKKLSILKFMAEKGISLESPGPGDVWPIHLAVATGSDKIVRFMIDQNVRTDRKDAAGNTIMHYAIYGKKIDCPVTAKPQPLIPAPVVEKIPFNTLLAKTNDLVLQDMSTKPELVDKLRHIANSLANVTEMQQVSQLLDNLQSTISDIFLENAMNPNYSSNLANYQSVIQSQIDEIYAAVNNDIVKGALTPIDLAPGNGGWGLNATDDRSKITRKTIDELKKEAENYRASVVNEIEKESSGNENKEGVRSDAVSFIRSFQENAQRLDKLFKDYLIKFLFCPDCKEDEFYGSRTTMYRFLFLYLYHDYHTNYGGYIAEKLIDSNQKILDNIKFDMIFDSLNSSIIPVVPGLDDEVILPVTYGNLERTIQASVLARSVMDGLEGDWALIAPLLAVQVYNLQENYPYYAVALPGNSARNKQIVEELIPRAMAALVGFRAWISVASEIGVGVGNYIRLKNVIEADVANAGYVDNRFDINFVNEIHTAANGIFSPPVKIEETDTNIGRVIDAVFGLFSSSMDPTEDNENKILVRELIIVTSKIKSIENFRLYQVWAEGSSRNQSYGNDTAENELITRTYLNELLKFENRNYMMNLPTVKGSRNRYTNLADKMTQVCTLMLEKAKLVRPDGKIDMESVIALAHAYAPAISIRSNPNLGYRNYLGSMVPVTFAYNQELKILESDPRKLTTMRSEPVEIQNIGTQGKNFRSLNTIINNLNELQQNAGDAINAGTGISDILIDGRQSITIARSKVSSGKALGAIDKIDNFSQDIAFLKKIAEEIVENLEALKNDIDGRPIFNPGTQIIRELNNIIDNTLDDANTFKTEMSNAYDISVALTIQRRVDDNLITTARTPPITTSTTAPTMTSTQAENNVAQLLKTVIISLKNANISTVIDNLRDVITAVNTYLNAIDPAISGEITTIPTVTFSGAIVTSSASYQKIVNLEWIEIEKQYKFWTENPGYDGSTTLSSTMSQLLNTVDGIVPGTISKTLQDFLLIGSPSSRPPAQIAIRDKLLQYFSMSGDNHNYVVPTERNIQTNILDGELGRNSIITLMTDLQVSPGDVNIDGNESFLSLLNNLLEDVVPLIKNPINIYGAEAVLRSDPKQEDNDIYRDSFFSKYPYIPRTPFQYRDTKETLRVQTNETLTLTELFLLFNAIYQILVTGQYRICGYQSPLIQKGIGEWEKTLDDMINRPVRIPESRYQVSIGTIGETYPWFIILYRILIRQTMKIIRQSVARPINQTLISIKNTPLSINSRYDTAVHQGYVTAINDFLEKVGSDEIFYHLILPAKNNITSGATWTSIQLQKMDQLRDQIMHDSETRKKLMDIITALKAAEDWDNLRGLGDKIAFNKRSEVGSLLEYGREQNMTTFKGQRQAMPLNFRDVFREFVKNREKGFVEMIEKLNIGSLSNLYNTVLNTAYESIPNRLLAQTPTISLEAAMTDVFGYQILHFSIETFGKTDDMALVNKIIQDIALLFDKKVPYLIAQFLLPKLTTVIIKRLNNLASENTNQRTYSESIKFLLSHIRTDSGPVATTQIPTFVRDFLSKTSADSEMIYRGLQSLISYHHEITQTVNMMSAFNLSDAAPDANGNIKLARVFSKELPKLGNLPEKLDDFLANSDTIIKQILEDYKVQSDLVYYSDNSSIPPGSNVESEDTPVVNIFPKLVDTTTIGSTGVWNFPIYWGDVAEVRSHSDNFGGLTLLFGKSFMGVPFKRKKGTKQNLPNYSQPHNVIYRGIPIHLLAIVPNSIPGQFVDVNGTFGQGFIAYRERGERNSAEGALSVIGDRLESHLIIVKQEIVEKAIELFATVHPIEYAELSKLGGETDYQADPVRAQIIVGRLADSVVNKAIEYSLREAIAGAILRMAQSKNPGAKIDPLKRIIDLVHADVVTKINMTGYETNELQQIMNVQPEKIDTVLPQIEPPSRPNTDLIHHIYNINYYSGNTSNGVSCYQVNPKIIERLANLANLIQVENINGDFPLHLAITNLNPRAVEILLDQGANPNSFKDKIGRSAIDLAIIQLNTHLDYVQGSSISERLSGFVDSFNNMLIQSLQSGAAKNNIIKGVKYAIPIMLCIYQHMHLSYLNNYRYGISHRLRTDMSDIVKLSIPNVPYDMFDFSGSQLINILKYWYPEIRASDITNETNAANIRAAQAGIKIYQNQIESYQKDLINADPETQKAINQALIDIQKKKSALEKKITAKDPDQSRVEANAVYYPGLFQSIKKLPKTLDELEFYNRAFRIVAKETAVHMGFWKNYQSVAVPSAPSMIIFQLEDVVRSITSNIHDGVLNTLSEKHRNLLEKLSTIEEYLDIIRRYSNIKSSNPNLADNPALEHEYHQIVYVIGLILTPAIKNIFLKQVIEGILAIKRDLGGLSADKILDNLERLNSGGETIESYLTKVLPMRACKFYNMVYSNPEDPDRKITRSEDLYEPLIQIILTTDLTQLTDQSQLIKDLRSYLIPFFSDTYQKVIHHLRLVIYSYDKYLLNSWQLIKVLKVLCQKAN